MHPLFTSLRRLGTYLIGWLIVAVLMAAVSTRLGLSWLEALTLLVPLFLVYRSSACPPGTSAVRRLCGQAAACA